MAPERRIAIMQFLAERETLAPAVGALLFAHLDHSVSLLYRRAPPTLELGFLAQPFRVANSFGHATSESIEIPAETTRQLAVEILSGRC